MNYSSPGVHAAVIALADELAQVVIAHGRTNDTRFNAKERLEISLSTAVIAAEIMLGRHLQDIDRERRRQGYELLVAGMVGELRSRFDGVIETWDWVDARAAAS